MDEKGPSGGPPAAPTRGAARGGAPCTPDPHGFDCTFKLSLPLKLFFYEIRKQTI